MLEEDDDDEFEDAVSSVEAQSKPEDKAQPAPTDPAGAGSAESGWGSVVAVPQAEFKLPASAGSAPASKLSAGAPAFKGSDSASEGGGAEGGARATVYVGNLPFGADESELRDTLMAFGKVVSRSLAQSLDYTECTRTRSHCSATQYDGFLPRCGCARRRAFR